MVHVKVRNWMESCNWQVLWNGKQSKWSDSGDKRQVNISKLQFSLIFFSS